jgi:hypothetical protein
MSGSNTRMTGLKVEDDVATIEAVKTSYTFDRMTRPGELFTSYNSGTEFAGQIARPFALPVYRILEAAADATNLLTHALQAIESISKGQWNDAPTGYDRTVFDEDGDTVGLVAETRDGLHNNFINMAHDIVGNFGYKDAKGTLDDSGIIRKVVAALASFINEAIAFVTRGVTTLASGVYKGGAYAMNSMFACCKPGNKAASASASVKQDDAHVGNIPDLRTSPLSMTPGDV